MEDNVDDIKEELTLDEILQLKEKFSKKVFHNFLNKSYASKSSKHTDDSSSKQITGKDNPADREFEQIFGCKRPQNYRPTITGKVLNLDRKANEAKEEEVPAHERPQEKSAKYRPSKLRTIFKAKANKIEPELRDPRFEQSSGFFNPTRFDKSYSFLKEARSADKLALKRELKRTKSETKKSEISKAIQRMDNQEKSEFERARKQQLKQSLIEEKRSQLKQKEANPVYVNKGELKKKALVEKFKELKSKNQLNKYLERKRKKNTSKERKKMFANDHE